MRYLTVMFLFLVGGCQFIDEPIEVAGLGRMRLMPERVAITDQGGAGMERRFTDSGQGADSAVESALLLSQKYQELSVETEKLRQDNSRLQLDNGELNRRVEQLKGELDKTCIELSEANEFLQQMHIELGKWKSDVLGYRDEMRSAQAAEIEALKKILRILGAEFNESVASGGVSGQGQS